MEISVIEEPQLEFGYSGIHQEQRAGLVLHGPADIEMEGRCDQISVGLVGAGTVVDDLRSYLTACTKGIAAKDTEFIELFPEFLLKRESKVVARQSAATSALVRLDSFISTTDPVEHLRSDPCAAATP